MRKRDKSLGLPQWSLFTHPIRVWILPVRSCALLSSDAPGPRVTVDFFMAYERYCLIVRENDT